MTQKHKYAIEILKREAERERALASFKSPNSEIYKESGKHYQELYEAFKVLEREGEK